MLQGGMMEFSLAKISQVLTAAWKAGLISEDAMAEILTALVIGKEL